MFCHNKRLFRARSEGLGRLAHSVYTPCPILTRSWTKDVTGTEKSCLWYNPLIGRTSNQGERAFFMIKSPKEDPQRTTHFTNISTETRSNNVKAAYYQISSEP